MSNTGRRLFFSHTLSLLVLWSECLKWRDGGPYCACSLLLSSEMVSTRGFLRKKCGKIRTKYEESVSSFLCDEGVWEMKRTYSSVWQPYLFKQYLLLLISVHIEEIRAWLTLKLFRCSECTISHSIDFRFDMERYKVNFAHFVVLARIIQIGHRLTLLRAKLFGHHGRVVVELRWCISEFTR